MSIKEKKVKVNITNRNKFYETKKLIDEDRMVLISNLSKGSKTLVTKICDKCGKESEQPFKNVMTQRKKSGGKDYCFYCGNNKPESLKRKSEARKGRVWSAESKLKSSISHTGHKHSEETKKKISKKVKLKMRSEEWRIWIKKYNYENYSLESYKKKYGEKVGLKLYKKERLVKCPRCIEYWLIKTRGDADKAAELLGNFQRRDLSYFIQKYGENEGNKKYENWCWGKLKNNFKKSSKASEEFFIDLIKELKLNEDYIHYSPNEFIVKLTKLEKEQLNRNFISLDYVDINKNIVIEYDGDYWHSREEQRKIDKKRDEILKNKGYKILRILHSNCIKNQKSVFKTVREFYENN